MNTVIISSHVLLPGAAHALRDYLLKKKVKKILFIALPLIDQRSSFSTIYTNGIQQEESVFKRKYNLGVFEYFLDFLWVSFFSFKFGKAQLFVGVDPLNAFVGIILKKLGRVNKVIYYGIDFVPIRFENKVLNYFFHLLESYCVKNAEEVWNVSERISEGRQKFLKIDPKKYPQKTVPIGVNSFSSKKVKFRKYYSLLFIGHLLEKQGVQMVIDAIPLVAKRIRNFNFVIVGDGEYKDYLIRKVKKMKLEKHLEFNGWVNDRKLLENIMKRCDASVACYKPEKERLRNFSYYADPTKIKDYLSFSLPVILTDVSYNAKEIVKKECGIMVRYNKEDIAKAIIKLFSNDEMLGNYQNNACSYMKKFTWEKIFNNALKLNE